MRTQLTMTARQLAEQKAHLEAKIHEYIAQLRNEDIDPDVDEADPGMVSQGVLVALLSNARQNLAAINRALQQLQHGGYGICETCGGEINPERLEIFPQSTMCVACKSKQEQHFWLNPAMS